MNALLLVVTLTSIVLRSGDRIVVEGPVRQESGTVVFRSGGLLYSLPQSEVAAVEPVPLDIAPPVRVTPTDARRRLPVSEEERKRLLAELEKNHSGAPGPQKAPDLPPPPTQAEVKEQTQDEWAWRREARAHEEAIVRAKEDLELLHRRVDEIRSKIFSLVSLGYKPHQFTYDSTQLERTLRQIPYAELALTRAERAYAQFRDDARRQGILPGWLR